MEGAKYSGRAGMTMDKFRAFTPIGSRPAPMRIPAGRNALVPPPVPPVCRWPVTTTKAIPMRARFRALGAHICEFPTAEEVGRDARALGEHVVWAAPTSCVADPI